MSSDNERITRLETIVAALMGGVTLDNPGVALPNRIDAAIHDNVHGWKKGDLVSGGDGTTYLDESPGKFITFTDPVYESILGAADLAERAEFFAAVNAKLVERSADGLEALKHFQRLSFAEGMTQHPVEYPKFRAWYSLYNANLTP